MRISPQIKKIAQRILFIVAGSTTTFSIAVADTIVADGGTYLHETKLDLTWLCKENYWGRTESSNNGLKTWARIFGTNRTDYYIETEESSEDAYFVFEPGVSVYNPTGYCSHYKASATSYGRLFFGREFRYTRINAERELISAEDIVTRSEGTLGALVRAQVNYQSGWSPYFARVATGKLQYFGYWGDGNQYYHPHNKGEFYLSIYYLDNNGSWVRAARKTLPYNEWQGYGALYTKYHRNLTLEVRLPQSIDTTIIKAAIEAGPGEWDSEWISGLPLDVSMFSLQAETCVPDLANGNCL